MEKWFVLLGLMLLCIAQEAMAASWNDKFIVADSIEMMGNPHTYEVSNYHYERSDTSWIVWEGKTGDNPRDIFLTYFTWENGELNWNTRNLSNSNVNSTNPQIVAAYDYEEKFVSWVEGDTATGRSHLLFTTGIEGRWSQPDTFCTVDSVVFYRLNNDMVTPHSGGSIIYSSGTGAQLYQSIYNLYTDSVTVTDTIETDGYLYDALSDFGVIMEFEYDYFYTVGFGVCVTDSVWSLYRGQFSENWETGVGVWGLETQLFTSDVPIEELICTPGQYAIPRLLWWSRTGEQGAYYLASYAAIGTDDLGWTAWDSVQTIETFGDAADNFVLDYLEPSRTMIAWDAEVNGNREIFVQDDRFTDSPVQITSNISNDSEPLIIHHKVSSDSFNVTVLWKSDRTGTARIWAATNRVPVAVDDEPNIPQDYQVSQNYPNPFNAQTTIEYTIPHPGNVTIDIYNVRGQLLRSYTSSIREPGEFAFQWNGTTDTGAPVSSGVYLINVKYYDSIRRVSRIKKFRAILIK